MTSSMMVDVLVPFVDELRTAGLPVGVTEHLDAARAVSAVSFVDRTLLKHALGATLAKTRSDWVTFETVFDAYFATTDVSEPDGMFRRRVERIVAHGDDRALRLAAREAVRRYAALDAPPGGVHFHLFRTARRLDLATLGARASALARADPLTALEEHLVRRTVARRVDLLREEIEDEIRRRVVLDDAARAPVGTLPTHLEFRRASAGELEQIRSAIQPLARRLAARLAKRRRAPRGRLDFRHTVRRSLAFGGVPLDPVIRHRRRSRPELMVLADVSRSVAEFSRFTLQLVHALSTELGRVRSFVFVDAIEEVTELLRDRAGVADALRDLGSGGGAGRVQFDGHSDYGAALQEFWRRWGQEVTARTTLVVLGDARNNHHASQAWVLGELRRRARRLYWLNPEPSSSWDAGDSLMSEYTTFAHQAVECRNLGQLERVVEAIV